MTKKNDEGKTIRYLTKNGDVTEAYEVGSNLTVKWNITYKILSSRYNSKTDKTFIKLQKDPQ